MRGAREKAERGELLFGTVETWLIWKLTKGAVHVTDYSNASRTMLFNINTLTWDKEILELFDIPEQMLPKPKPSSCIYGMTDRQFFGDPIPIGARREISRPLFSARPVLSRAMRKYIRHRLLSPYEYRRPAGIFKERPCDNDRVGAGGKCNLCVGGSIFAAGAAIQWLRDELRLIGSAADSEYMAEKVKDTNGCYVVPAFTGLGAPHWDAYARGAILGLTRG